MMKMRMQSALLSSIAMWALHKRLLSFVGTKDDAIQTRQTDFFQYTANRRRHQHETAEDYHCRYAMEECFPSATLRT